MVAVALMSAVGCSLATEERAGPIRPTRASPPARDGKGAPGGDPGAVVLETEVVADGFNAPLLVTNAGDASERLFVVEQTGAVRIIEDGAVLPEPFLDLSDRIVAGGEQGLLGLAFHPDYGANGRFFVDYTDTNGDTVISELSVSGDPDRADADSERVLLHIDQPYANHNGGNVIFGPDGYLYIGMGDGGSGGDPEGNGQDLSTLLGKLLRIDVDSGDPYGIPQDNPFVDDTDARPEIFAYGLRNPWRYSFDAATGDLWIADVGQSEFEEVDHVGAGRSGMNFGWNVMEGPNCFTEEGCDTSGLVLPVSGYSHEEGCSITGGHVYRGPGSPALRGVYVFGDYCSGTLWGLDARATSPVEPTALLEYGSSVSSFGLDESGELYMTDIATGEVLRLSAR